MAEPRRMVMSEMVLLGVQANSEGLRFDGLGQRKGEGDEKLRLMMAWRMPSVTLTEERMRREEGVTTNFMLSGVLEL
jgi:hypothetical protein